MLFGDELPQSIRNISQVKRMAAKSIGHDRRKASSSSTSCERLIIRLNLFVNPFRLRNLMGLFFSDEEKKLIELEVQKMLQKLVLLDTPRFIPDNSFLTCLLSQRKVAI